MRRIEPFYTIFIIKHSNGIPKINAVLFQIDRRFLVIPLKQQRTVTPLP